MNNQQSTNFNQAIAKLRQLIQIDVQNQWYFCDQDLPLNRNKIDVSHWQPATANDKGYLIWSSGSQVRWFAQKIVIPQHLQNYPLTGLTLRLVLTWWAQKAEIFVNGKLVQEGDLFDSSARILLTPQAHPHQEINVRLRLVSPSHDIGALMGSFCLYENPRFPVFSNLDPGFVADELEILHKYLAAFEPETLELLAREINEIDWSLVNRAVEFNQCLSKLRHNLQPLAENLSQRSFHMLGHAHLDMAWLWQVEETYRVGKRTFASVLNLQQDFPELKFGHTSPALYDWVEKNHPELFAQIQEAVRQGRWEILGGMWVEPEVNLISGESLVRQLLYGQRYYQEKFGAIATVAWLPDSFGFCWQLPQICAQAGIEYFVTGKLHWGDTTKFPHGVFWWQAPDGTQLLTLISPPNVAGVMDTNPLTMTDYAVDWEQQTGLQAAMWLPGVGDHGGGPTRDMLEVQQRWQHSPFFPRLEFSRAVDYLESVTSHQSSVISEPSTINHQQFPVWNDELYLEFHRGCYTTHAEQKLSNRRCEGLLYQAELFSSLATITCTEANYEYPAEILEKAWKKVLFNQFHDILPGTSIPQVFVDANQAWQEVETVTTEIVQSALSAIATQIKLPTPPHPQAQPLLVFNPLNWKRSEVIEVTPPPGNWAIYNREGKKLLSQSTYEQKLLFLAENIPSVGYCLFWLCPQGEETRGGESADFILENEYLRVIINPETGDISSIFDKSEQREVLAGAANQLQAFQDSGQYWDAWNIDPQYQHKPLPGTKLSTIEWLEWGNLRLRLRVVRTLGKSEFRQDYILTKNSPLLVIETTANWQENHVLFKAAFPLNLEADLASYEIPCGAIERPTIVDPNTNSQPRTPAQQAKWEVPALHWADLTTGTAYGVSILNDCKHGYDAQPNQLRLTLLRSSKWPDPLADQGIHHFTYAIYPHSGSWQSAGTVRQGYELNFPLQVCTPASKGNNKPSLNPVGSCLDLGAKNLVLMALKLSEDEPDTLIMRCYECHGQPAKLSLHSDLGLTLSEPVDLLERPWHKSTESQQKKQQFPLLSWKIATYKLHLM